MRWSRKGEPPSVFTVASVSAAAMRSKSGRKLPGVGPARKRTLLNHFGSPEAVVAATREQLEHYEPGNRGLEGADFLEHRHAVGCQFVFRQDNLFWLLQFPFLID